MCECSKVARPHWQPAGCWQRSPRGEPWRDCPAGEPTQLDTRGGEKVAGLLPPQPSSGQQLKLLFDFCFLSFPQVVGATMSLCFPPSPISILVPSRGHYSRGRRRSHGGPGQGGMSSFTVAELSVASHGGVLFPELCFWVKRCPHFIINPSNSVRLVFLQGVSLAFTWSQD